MESKKVRNLMFLIGNGFDLAHNNPTRYLDFMLWYLNDFLNKAKLQPKYSDLLISKKTDKENERRVLNSYSIHRLENTYKVFDGLYDFKPLLERILSTQIGYNWVDIEAEYFKLLRTHFTDYEKNEIVGLNSELEYLKERFCEYLNGLTYNNNDIQISSIIETFTENYTNENNEEDKDFVTTFYYLNFNYTETFVNYFTRTKNWRNVINLANFIHGRLSERNINKIVFGYGNEEEEDIEKMEAHLHNKSFLKHIKSYSYYRNDSYKNLLNFIDSLPFDICILGHSCGKSDGVLLKEIFEHENCKNIHVSYYKDEEEFIEKTMDIALHFSEKSVMRRKIMPFNKRLKLANHKNN